MLATLHTVTKKILPSWLYARIASDWDKDGFKKYFRNTSWIALAKFTTFIISFLSIIAVARYLGPDNLGKISYAQSFVAIFSAFASLGIDQIVYRNLAARPENQNEILGTAIVTKLVFGTVTCIATIILSLVLNTDLLLTWLIAFIALGFIFQPFGLVTHVFNARVLSKYPSYITLFIAFFIPLLKLCIIYIGGGVLYFAVLITFEAFLFSVLNLYLYKIVLKESILSLRYSWKNFVELLRDSWPLLLAGVSGYLYARIDQVMIQHYIDSAAVGLYDIAVKLTEFMGFLPGIIIGSLLPAVINAKKTNTTEYSRRLTALTTLCMSLSFASALFLFLVADYLINFMFGDEFAASAAILKIYVWSTLGTVAISLMYNYFVVENKTSLFLIFTVGGAVINIFLNSVCIPVFGVYGAAYATLLTFIITISTFILYYLLYVRAK